MAATFHRPLKFIAFNANGIWRRRYELSKQLKDLHIDMVLLSETHLKHHERFFIPNYHFYGTGRFPGRKGIPHNHVELCYMCDTRTWQRRSLFIRDKPILSSEKMLYKDYDCKRFSCKKTLVVSLKGLVPKTNWLAVTASRKVTLTLIRQSELRVSRSHDVVVRWFKTGNDVRRIGHWWDPLLCKDWWRHGKLRRHSGYCCNLLIVQISYSVVITCSYEL
jgi:hypothetical protein